MPFHCRWLLLCALCLPARPLHAVPPATAQQLWEQGQEAMKQGDLDRAAQCYQQSLRLDPKLARNYLSLAALHVARSEDAAEEPWLARYDEAQPDHYIV